MQQLRAMNNEPLTKSEFPTVPESVKADLLRIGGTNDYGEPKLQLVWGQERTWFRAGKERLKYPSARKLRRLAAWNIVYLPTGAKYNLPAGPQPQFSDLYLVSPVFEDQEIGYQGWVLEEWWPADLVCASWEANRYVEHKGEKIDLLGEPPVRGDYRFMLYCDDGQEPATPLKVDDRRLIEIIELAYKLREDQGAADGWRSIQSPEKAYRMQELIRQDRERTTAEEKQEFEDLLVDTLKGGYARKLRHAYLS